MSVELLVAQCLFAFVSSITLGPNNIMLMNSGANYGFRKTIPHALGVGLGFTLMIVLVGLGVMKIFDAFPMSYQILKVASIAYLLYLAVKIALSGSSKNDDNSKSKPMTFIQAALFQWVNPKAWTMALTAISIYAPTQNIFAVAVVASVFGIVNLPCISVWVVLGQKMQLFLHSQLRMRTFNIAMAALLVVSVLPAI